jgi:hypothetical protein
LWSFGIFFPVWVFCTKQNLATLPGLPEMGDFLKSSKERNKD